MSIHSDNVYNHAIHTQLVATKTLISECLQDDGLQEDSKNTILRMNLIVENLEQSINIADTNLLSVTWLQEANASLVNMTAALKNYLSAKLAQQTTNALRTVNTQLDAILNITAKINLIKSEQTFSASTKALEEHASIIGGTISNFEKRLTKAKEIVSEVEKLYNSQRNSIDEQKSEISKFLSDSKIRFDKLIEEYQSKVLEGQEKHSKAIQADSDKFTTALSTYKKEIDLVKTQMSSDFKEICDEFTESLGSFESNAKYLIEQTGKDFDSYKKTVEEIVGLLSRDSFSHKYKGEADSARGRAEQWHWLAVGTMILAAAFTIFAFYFAAVNDTTWINLVTKILVTSAVGSVAVYAAKQASKQEEIEIYTRRTELELAAFDPFVSNLDKEKQQELKDVITRRIFGNTDISETIDSEVQK